MYIIKSNIKLNTVIYILFKYLSYVPGTYLDIVFMNTDVYHVLC